MVGAHADLASAAALTQRLDREPRLPVVLYSGVSDRSGAQFAAHPGRDQSSA
jgi:hypothetical protein